MKIENYNNIGIGLVALLSVIKDFEDLDYAKALLIQPLLLHNPLTNYGEFAYQGNTLTKN